MRTAETLLVVFCGNAIAVAIGCLATGHTSAAGVAFGVAMALGAFAFTCGGER